MQPGTRMRKAKEDAPRVAKERSIRTRVDAGTAGLTRSPAATRLPQAFAHPVSASPADILGLQRTLGNRATSRLLAEARERPTAPPGAEAGVAQAKSLVDEPAPG